MEVKYIKRRRVLTEKSVKIMFDMKNILFKHGIKISVSTPDAYDQLIKASQDLSDESLEELKNELISEIEQREASTTEPAELPAQPLSAISHSSQLLPERQSDQAQRLDRPIHKAMRPWAPYKGIMTCDRCQAHIIEDVDGQEDAPPMTLRCRCGQLYDVKPESRRYLRNVTQLEGTYFDAEDADKKGLIRVANFSFGGVQFHTVSPHNLVVGDCLHIQFTLDDPNRTFIWEEVWVCHILGDTVGVEFVDHDTVLEQCADYR